MVLVALVGGIDAIQQDRQPIHALARQRIFDRLSAARHHVPNAVRLHVVFVDDVQAQLVADGVERAAVGIMAGADGVDVV